MGIIVAVGATLIILGAMHKKYCQLAKQKVKAKKGKRK